MKKRQKFKIKKFLFGSVSGLLSCLAVYCVILRISEALPDYDNFQIFAAQLAMPTGQTDIKDEQTSAPQQEVKENTKDKKTDTKSNAKDSNPKAKDSSAEGEKASITAALPTTTKEDIAAYDKAHKNEEKYDIYEDNFTGAGEAYDNFYVKKNASIDINIGKELNGKLGFKPEKTDEPQVLIVHTHACESYLPYDIDYYYESYYPRTTDNSKNVCAVGEAIKKSLEAKGIVTIHDTTQHDDPSYSGAYDRSMETIQKYLKKYPSIKVVLDIHRDAFSPAEDGSMTKPVFTYDGKNAAQIMIMAGCDPDGSENYPDWRYNLRFALKLQNTAETLYPGMTRPLNYGDFSYNMMANTGSLLIEVGTDGNSLAEAVYSGSLLGNVIAKTLEDNY